MTFAFEISRGDLIERGGLFGFFLWKGLIREGAYWRGGLIELLRKCLLDFTKTSFCEASEKRPEILDLSQRTPHTELQQRKSTF